MVTTTKRITKDDIKSFLTLDSSGSSVDTAGLFTHLCNCLNTIYFSASGDTTGTREGSEAALEVAITTFKNALSTSTFKALPDYPTSLDGASITKQVRERIAEIQRVTLPMCHKMEDTSTALIDGWESNAEALFAAAVEDYPTGVDQVTVSQVYVHTYVTDWGEESAPSQPTSILELDQNDTVALKRVDVPVNQFVNKWRVYRSVTGTQSSAFQLQGEYDISTTQVEDSTSPEYLAEVCATHEWMPPPTGLSGLVSMPNGIMLGFVGATLHACEPYAPYAWPAKYDSTLDFNIVGICVFGQSALIGTTGSPYVVSGTDSASLTLQKLESNQACMSKESMVMIGGTVMYASPDGLAVLEGTRVTVLTENLLSKTTWATYNPSSIKAAEYENRYFGFFTRTDGTKGCLVVDLSTKGLFEVPIQADAAFSSTRDNMLFTLDGAGIYNAIPDLGIPHSMKWWSRIFTMPAPTAMAWLHVDADFPGIVGIKIYTDGEVFFTTEVTDMLPVRLPAGRYTNWQIEVTTSTTVRSVVVATTTEELKQVP